MIKKKVIIVFIIVVVVGGGVVVGVGVVVAMADCIVDYKNGYLARVCLNFLFALLLCCTGFFLSCLIQLEKSSVAWQPLLGKPRNLLVLKR